MQIHVKSCLGSLCTIIQLIFEQQDKRTYFYASYIPTPQTFEKAMPVITVNLYHIDQYYKVQVNTEQKISDLAVAASKVIELQPENMIFLIQKRFAALEHHATIQEYEFVDNETVIVLGSNIVAADPSQQYTDAQLRRIMLEQQAQAYPVGIDNPAQLCYLIASVQALYAVEAIRDAVMKVPQGADPALLTLQTIFKQLSELSDKIDITTLANLLGQRNAEFADFQKQHDAQEALAMLENQLITPLFKDGNPFFCTFTNNSNDDFIRMNITKDVEAVAGFLEKQKEYGILFKNAPKFLQIQFLRFSIDQHTQKVNKITKKITYGNQIILDKYIEDADENKKENNYDLVAVIAHQGQETTSGHYVCYAKHNDIWYLFNDNYVAKIDQQKLHEVQGGQANTAISYVLIYQLKVK